MSGPRLAVRAVIVEAGRLLLVNAYAGRDHLWCAPGGGVERHRSLPDNLAREVREETGLEIAVGAPCLVNEFHDPDSGFHQVEVFFRAEILPESPRPGAWHDPQGIVQHHRWVTEAEFRTLLVRPVSLGTVAWGAGRDRVAALYDDLETILR